LVAATTDKSCAPYHHGAARQVDVVPRAVQRDNSIELKAGTKKKQHMIGLTPVAGGTQFEVVFLDETPRSKQ
jgi:hypothetical protein